MSKIIIVIPTYKEKDNIFKLTNKILKLIPKSNIFIVDDTPQDSLKESFKDKRIKYFHRKNKKGRGSAVLFGFRKSLNSKLNTIFIEMDADFSHDPRELKRNIKYFMNNKLDLLIASRYLKESQIKNWGVFRSIFSKLSNFLASILLNVGVSDYTNGYRVYSRRSINLITSQCGNIGDGFIVLSEILLTINLKKFKIGELPTVFINRKRGESSVNLKLIIQSLLGLFKLYVIKILKK